MTDRAFSQLVEVAGAASYGYSGVADLLQMAMGVDNRMVNSLFNLKRSLQHGQSAQ